MSNVTKAVNQSQNGIKVIVYHSDGGTVVEADCACHGTSFRSHSTMSCPNFKRQQASK